MKVLRTLGIFCAAVLIGLALGMPSNVQAAPTFVNAAAPDLPDQARGVPMGGALRVFGLNLAAFGEVTLELERFAVFAPNARIEVVDGPSVPVPDVAYFRGRVASVPDSVAFLAVSKSGEMRGVVRRYEGAWILQRRPSIPILKNRKVDLEKELAGRTFECLVHGEMLTPGQMDTGGLSTSGEAALPAPGIPVDVRYTAHMIIDTDYEYWQRFWNIYQPDPFTTARMALEYLGDLLAYASIPYERGVHTNLLITYARLFATDTDPYSANTNLCGCDGSGKLQEVQSVWNGDSTPRTMVHFISGKTEGCGCSYSGLCSTSSGYAASSDIGTGFDIDNPGFMWEGYVIAHETGHTFGSPHTQAYCGVGGVSDAVDLCVNGEDSCSGQAAQGLPGLGTLSGGVTANHPGTIMSYCHQVLGGYQNIAHTFGEYHPYGVAAYRVPNHMLANVLGSTGCMSLEYIGSNLRVFKDCKPDDPMLVGKTAICTISVQNYGPQMALGVEAVDEFLSNGTFTIGAVTVTKGVNIFTNMCSTTGNTVTCDVGDIDSGHSAIIAIPVTANTPQNINNRVTIYSDSVDPDSTDNIAEDEVNFVEIADLQVFKDCKPDDPLLAGQPGICTIIVKNWGPSQAKNVRLEDVHVSNGTFTFGTITQSQGSCTPGGGKVNCSLGNLSSGAEATVTVQLLANEGQNINDTATASSDSYDPDMSNNSASDGVGVEPVADLALTKTATPPSVVAGTALTYNLTATNAGPSTAKNVVIADVLPQGVTIQSVTSPNGSCNAGEPGNPLLPTKCNVDTLPVLGSASMQINVTVNPDILGTILNNARVYSDLFDNNNRNNLAEAQTAVSAEADLEVVKADSPDPVIAGSKLKYELTVTNHGPSTAKNIMLIDELPPEVSFDGYIVSNGSGTCVPKEGSPKTVECELNNLNPGEHVTVFLQVLVDKSVADGTVIVDEVSVSSATPDPNAGNNSAIEETTVNAMADLAISKDASFLTNNPAANVLYTLLVSNSGPSDALNVVVVDTLPLTPKKIVYVMDSGNGACSYNKANHEVTCNFGTLPAGGSISLNIAVKTLGSVGRITNVANVSSSTSDANLSNNRATKEILVKGSTQK